MVRAVFLIVGLLAGCAPEARDIALADVDLRNMQTVGTIRARLAPNERIAFANFIARHHIKSANFCGQPLVAATGKEPATVGEAVDLSMLRDAAERKALIEAKSPKHSGQLAREEWNAIISARDILLDSQTRLRIEYGENAVRRAEWKILATKMAEIDRKLIKMKPVVFGSGPY
ncbi:MAG: hypothetical protein V4657_03355 [Pseudomonadota bacterium]